MAAAVLANHDSQSTADEIDNWARLSTTPPLINRLQPLSR
jgi:hypothetical protein